MQIVTADFETYYDRDFSLSKMSTEDYIKDPRFEVILVAAKVNDGATKWFSGTKAKTREWLQQFDIENSAVVCHNAMFDATIFQEHFGMVPKFIFDTISMAQAHLRPFLPSVSLKSCLEYCDFDGLRKGDEVHNMLGRTRASLSKLELERYADYCITDVDGTYLLFRHLLPITPRTELMIIDQTHRMYLNPVLELDATLLAEILAEEKAKKDQLMNSLSALCGKDDLMSNEKFATVLRSVGVDPPMKTSLTTGQPTYAFAKGDPEFKQLQEDYSEDLVVSALLAARLGVKSTISETRTERLLEIAKKHKRLRVPLNYYGAHTGRYSGSQKINLQNLGRVNKKLGRRQLRYALRAPKGHVVLAADLSQIEARIVAWLAQCATLVTAFGNKADVYSEFASVAYKQTVVKGRSQEDDQRRFVGKTCILGLGYGMGPDKLKVTLNKDGVKVPLTEAQRLVKTYRDLYNEIPALWWKLDRVLPEIAMGGTKRVLGPCYTGKNIVVLPNGMPLYYNRLRKEDSGDWVYTYGKETRKLFGGKLAENIVQALARIVVMDNMLTIRNELGLQPVLQVHDELDYVIPEVQADEYAAEIGKIMSAPPLWAPDLPVAVEVAYGPTFGDCK